MWAFGKQKVYNVSYGFVIVHEGFFPFRNKKVWESSFMTDPVTFYPTTDAFLVEKEWKNYDFDKKHTREILESGALAEHGPHDPDFQTLSESRDGAGSVCASEKNCLDFEKNEVPAKVKNATVQLSKMSRLRVKSRQKVKMSQLW